MENVRPDQSPIQSRKGYRAEGVTRPFEVQHKKRKHARKKISIEGANVVGNAGEPPIGRDSPEAADRSPRALVASALIVMPVANAEANFENAEAPLISGAPEIRSDSVEPFEKRETKEDLQFVIEACEKVGRRNIFGRHDDERVEAFASAYRLYRIMDCDRPALEEVLARPYFGERERRPSRSKTALIALLLTVQPRTEADRKSASAWAKLLEWAGREDVPTNAFAEFAQGKRLKDIPAANGRGSGRSCSFRLPFDPALYPNLAKAVKASNGDPRRDKVLKSLQDGFELIEATLAADLL